MDTDLVGEALSFQLLLFESLLQSENLGLVLLHGQLDHLARLSDPLVGSCSAGETQATLRSAVVIGLEKGGWPTFSPDKQPNRLQAGHMPYPDPNYALLPDLLQSEGLTHFRPWVKILLKSKVPVRSRLERLNRKGNASQCN